MKRMTRTNNSIESVVSLLQHINPPNAILHVGAGKGTGAMSVWHQWSVEWALMIDADETRLDWAYELRLNNPNWQVEIAVLAETTEELDYFKASNSDEDGLISPVQLSSLWPNLQTKQEVRVKTQKLDDVLDNIIENPMPDSMNIWLIVECLPSLPVLKGALRLLEKASVLWLRVLLQPLPSLIEIATLDSIKSYLQAQGYTCVQMEESNHPAIGEVLFVKDWRAMSALDKHRNTLQQTALIQRQAELESEKKAVVQKLEEKNQLTDEQLIQITSFSKEHERITQQLYEQHVSLEALQQANASLIQEKNAIDEYRIALETEVQTIIQARDQQGQLANDRQAQVDVLFQERETIAHQLHEQHVSLEALQQANYALIQEKNAIDEQRLALEADVQSLMQARDQQAQLANDHQAQIDAFFQEREAMAQQFHERHVSLEVEVQDLVQSRDQHVQLANERLDALNQERVVLSQQLHDRQLQLDGLLQSNETLAQEKSALQHRCSSLEAEYGTHTLERDALVQQIQQSQTIISELTNQRDDAQQQRDQQVQLANDRQAQIDALYQERETIAQQLHEQLVLLEALQQANAALTQEKNEIVEHRVALEAEVQDLAQSRDQHVQLANERLDALHQEQIVLSQQLHDRQLQLDGLLQSNETLAQEKSALQHRCSSLEAEYGTHTLERDALVQQIQQSQTIISELTNQRDDAQQQQQQMVEHIQQLEVDNNEMKVNQQLLQEEMIKAEAQIDLIKDLLWREAAI